jgi:hypothetical protein
MHDLIRANITHSPFAFLGLNRFEALLNPGTASRFNPPEALDF